MMRTTICLMIGLMFLAGISDSMAQNRRIGIERLDDMKAEKKAAKQAEKQAEKKRKIAAKKKKIAEAKKDQTPPNRPLSAADIRTSIIGNTLSFKSPANGNLLTIFFAENGKALIRVKAKKFNQAWDITDQNMLCRKPKKGNKICIKIKRLAEAGKFEMFNKKVSYQASLLAGKQLPN